MPPPFPGPARGLQSLLDVLHKRVDVDFTVTNVCAIMMWVIKNTNRYIDLQLIETYDVMIDKCNAVLYKSNKRTWHEQKWRYCAPDETDKPSHFALDYRIVTHRVGGFGGFYSYDRGLNEKAADFLQDLITIAHNLGFDHPTMDERLTRKGLTSWNPGEKEEFHYHDRKKKRDELLFDVGVEDQGDGLLAGLLAGAQSGDVDGHGGCLLGRWGGR